MAAQTLPRYSATFDPHTLTEIRRAAAADIYGIRGRGTKRKLPHFDNLLFLGASISKYPPGRLPRKMRHRWDSGQSLCEKTDSPEETSVTIVSMSFGALSNPVEEVLRRGASLTGASTTTGDGGITQEERGHSSTRPSPYLPSRYGIYPDDPDPEGGHQLVSRRSRLLTSASTGTR